MKFKKDEIKLEHKNFGISFKVQKEKGIIEAYVSAFGNVDSYQEVIDRGAFTESLKKKFPKGVWSHNWDMPIAKTLEAHEDDKGLYIKGQFNLDTQRGKEAFSDLVFGNIDEFSIGYRVQHDEVDDAGIRHLVKIRLYEWSPVLVGANSETELISVKDEKKEKKEEKTEEEKIKVVLKADDEITAVVLLFKDALIQLNKSLIVLDKTMTPLSDLLLAVNKLTAGEKVAPSPDEKQKIVRIRQSAKKADKIIEKILRFTK